jgi:hypothetical protein
MNISMKYGIFAVLAASTALGATIQCAAEETEKSVCEKTVLGHKGCEVGDFDGLKVDGPGAKKNRINAIQAKDKTKPETPRSHSHKQQKTELKDKQ